MQGKERANGNHGNHERSASNDEISSFIVFSSLVCVLLLDNSGSSKE